MAFENHVYKPQVRFQTEFDNQPFCQMCTYRSHLIGSLFFFVVVLIRAALKKYCFTQATISLSN